MFLKLAILAVAAVSVLPGWSAEAPPAAPRRPLVVATIVPIYDWTRQIIGAQTTVDLVMLLDNGVDLHSYQPKAEDLARVGSADLFLYVGGESDEWVEDALEAAAG